MLVTSTVQRQVAGLFIAEDKGAHELKGVPVPITLYRIVRIAAAAAGRARELRPPLSAAKRMSLFSSCAGSGCALAKDNSC